MNSPMSAYCAAELRELGRCEARLDHRLRELELYDGEAAQNWTPETDSSLTPLREAVRQAQLNLNDAQQRYMAELMADKILNP